MKLISGILKFFAILLMAFVVIALPLAFLLRNISRVMFSPETIVQLLEENVLDADVLVYEKLWVWRGLIRYRLGVHSWLVFSLQNQKRMILLLLL